MIEQTLTSRSLILKSWDANDRKALTQNSHCLKTKTRRVLIHKSAINGRRRNKEGYLNLLMEGFDKRRFHNLARVTESVDDSDPFIRTTKLNEQRSWEKKQKKELRWTWSCTNNWNQCFCNGKKKALWEPSLSNQQVHSMLIYVINLWWQGRHF